MSGSFVQGFSAACTLAVEVRKAVLLLWMDLSSPWTVFSAFLFGRSNNKASKRKADVNYRPTRSTNFEIEANSAVWVSRLGGAKSVLLCGRYGCLRQGRCCCFRERLAAADQTANFPK